MPTKYTTKRQVEEDSFMTLSDKEIAGCINDIGISFTIQDLRNPNPQQIQRVFEWVAELLLNTTRDVVAPSMRAAADSVAGPYSETFSNDTIDLMGFFITLRRLLAVCGIQDFTFQDLSRPTSERLVKIFSYVINFIRFRESQTASMDEHINESERTKQRIEQLSADSHYRMQLIMDLEQKHTQAEALLKTHEASQFALKNELLRAKALQEQVAEDLERKKTIQSELKASLEKKTAQIPIIRQEAHTLRPYTEQSPAELEAFSSLSTKKINDYKNKTETLNSRTRALQASIDAFSKVHADVATATATLDEMSVVMMAQQIAETAAAKIGQDVLDRSNEVRDVEQEERQLLRQLDSIDRRKQKMQSKAEERRNGDAAKLKDLQRTHDELRRERTELQRDFTRMRMNNEQLEKKMADLAAQMRSECKRAEDEFLKMDSHIRLYIMGMDKSMDGSNFPHPVKGMDKIMS